jgi:hypothetical protein
MRRPKRCAGFLVPDLTVHVQGARVMPFAAIPTLSFDIRVTNQLSSEWIQSIALRCQIQIEAARRRYDRDEAVPLLDLFGEPERWSQTVRSMLWTHANIMVPAFAGTTSVELPVSCTFDFNVAATKYFYGLRDGDVPLLFLFSGSIFYETPAGALHVSPISWEKESRYSLPVNVWRDLMEAYYPNSNWLVLRRDVFDRLYRYKLKQGIPTWDEAVDRVLALAEEQVPL